MHYPRPGLLRQHQLAALHGVQPEQVLLMASASRPIDKRSRPHPNSWTCSRS